MKAVVKSMELVLKVVSYSPYMVDKLKFENWRSEDSQKNQVGLCLMLTIAVACFLCFLFPVMAMILSHVRSEVRQT